MCEVYYHEYDYCQLELVAESSSHWRAQSFRHMETDELDSGAFRRGKGLVESGRVLIRVPQRNGGQLLDEQYRAPNS